MNDQQTGAITKSQWISLLAEYGLEFVIELVKLLERTTDPSSQDFIDLGAKYGTKKAGTYLAEAEARAAAAKTP